MTGQDDNDNVYIDLSVAKQIIDDLFERDRKLRPDQCLCGCKQFTVEEGKFICAKCGLTYDQSQEVEEPDPASLP